MVTDSTSKGRVLVTGASSGIGAQLARVVAADGHDLVLTARREERLQALASDLEAAHDVDAAVLTQDLAEENAGTVLAEAVRERDLVVDVLVNNAGVPVYGRFTETDLADERDLLSVNVQAPTALAKAFLPGMVERDRGGILNTCSLASFYPMGKKAVYGASKAYLLSFSRALAHEVRDTDVTVTALCPGVVETEYAQRGDVEESETMSGVTNDPASVARAGWEGFQADERIVFPSTFATYAGFLERVLPRRTATETGTSVVEDGASWI